MTSGIQSITIGKPSGSGAPARGEDLLAAGDVELGKFDAALRKLDMAGNSAGDLADSGDTPGQIAGIPGNILPLASPIELPGGKFLPAGDEAPRSSEVDGGGRHAVLRAAPKARVPSPDEPLAGIPTGGLSVEQAVQPPYPISTSPIPGEIPTDTDATARADGASGTLTFAPAAMTAHMLGLQAVQNVAGEPHLASGQAGPAVQPATVQPGQQPDTPGQPPAAALPGQDRAPQPLEAAMNENPAVLSSRPKAEDGEEASLKPADGPAVHAPRELPSAPLPHSRGEVVAPGISRAFDGSAAPHLAEALENLVERLADARDRAREARGEMVLRHSEFGPVRAQIVERADVLQVSLSSRDPGFAPSAQAALGERVPHFPSQQQAWGNGNPEQGRAKWHGSQEQPQAEVGVLSGRRPDGESTGPSRRNWLFA